MPFLAGGSNKTAPSHHWSQRQPGSGPHHTRDRLLLRPRHVTQIERENARCRRCLEEEQRRVPSVKTDLANLQELAWAGVRVCARLVEDEAGLGRAVLVFRDPARARLQRLREDAKHAVKAKLGTAAGACRRQEARELIDAFKAAWPAPNRTRRRAHSFDKSIISCSIALARCCLIGLPCAEYDGDATYDNLGSPRKAGAVNRGWTRTSERVSRRTAAPRRVQI